MKAHDLPKWLHGLAKRCGYYIADNPDRPRLELLAVRDFCTCDGCGKPYHKSWNDPDYPELGPCCTGAD